MTIHDDKEVSQAEITLREIHSKLQHWPESLLKALNDPYDYALKTKSGDLILFSEAETSGEGHWVLLKLRENEDTITAKEMTKSFISKREGLPFGRGIEIRVADIEWCCDAPFGH